MNNNVNEMNEDWIKDARLDIIKDVVRSILNQTTYFTDEELNETQPTSYESGSITGSIEIENELKYNETIFQLALEIEKLSRRIELEKRVYSGETIIGGKKKMHWTEEGWVEGEKKDG